MKKIAFIILGMILLPILASAGGASGSWETPPAPTSGLLKGISGFCYENGNCTFCDVVKVGTNIFNFLRNSIAFPITVLFIIYGGVMMIFAGGSKSQAENGKKVLMAALIGFAIGAITAFSIAADVVTGGAMTNGMVIFLRALYLYFNNN